MRVFAGRLDSGVVLGAAFLGSFPAADQMYDRGFQLLCVARPRPWRVGASAVAPQLRSSVDPNSARATSEARLSQFEPRTETLIQINPPDNYTQSILPPHAKTTAFVHGVLDAGIKYAHVVVAGK